jgi:hypothetical protein
VSPGKKKSPATKEVSALVTYLRGTGSHKKKIRLKLSRDRISEPKAAGLMTFFFFFFLFHRSI